MKRDLLSRQDADVGNHVVDEPELVAGLRPCARLGSDLLQIGVLRYLGGTLCRNHDVTSRGIGLVAKLVGTGGPNRKVHDLPFGKLALSLGRAQGWAAAEQNQ